MSAHRTFPPSAFPFFHLRPFPYSTLPAQLDDLTTPEISLAWLLLDNLDTAIWRKCLRIWRARREKERGSNDGRGTPAFELLDMAWDLSEDMDFGFLDSAQIAALPLHPDYKPSMLERARTIFRQRRNPSSLPPPLEASEPGKPAVPDVVASVPLALAPQQSTPQLADESSAPTTSRQASPSTVPSSPAPATPEVRETSEANLALNRWMAMEKNPEKGSRTLAVDSFDWAPEPPMPVPTPIFHSFERRSISPFEEGSPTPTPEPEPQDARLTEQQTALFFDRLQFGAFGHGEDPGRADVKPAINLEDRLDTATIVKRSDDKLGESLLQRISGAPRLPSPAPSAVSTSNKPPPPDRIPHGIVPRQVTGTWCTFLLHSVLNKLPTEEIKAVVVRAGLPEPVAIQIKRNPPAKRFCLVFVAYETPQDRDLAAAGLDGLNYGHQKLRLIVKAVDKPATAYDWDWATTSERFRRGYFERLARPKREPSPKRRRLSSPVPRRRSVSPRRDGPLPPPSSNRGRSPSPRRPRSPGPPRRISPPPPPSAHRRVSPDRDRRRSPPPPILAPRGRSRSPVNRRRSSPPRVSPLDQPLPRSVADKLFTMILNNLPNRVTRSDVIDFFPPRTFVGLAINDPEDRRYLGVGAQRPSAHGSVFFAFDSGAARERFAREFCGKKYFKGSPVPLWNDFSVARRDEWIWREMMEDWAVKNGGPLPLATPSKPGGDVPPPFRARSPSLSLPLRSDRRELSNRAFEPPSAASLDRHGRARDYSFDESRSTSSFDAPRPLPPPPSSIDPYYYPSESSSHSRNHSRDFSSTSGTNYRPDGRHEPLDYRGPPPPPPPSTLPPLSHSHSILPSDSRYPPVNPHAEGPPSNHDRHSTATGRVGLSRKRATWSEEPDEQPPVLPPLLPPRAQYPPHFSHSHDPSYYEHGIPAAPPPPLSASFSSATTTFFPPPPPPPPPPTLPSPTMHEPYYHAQFLQSSAERYGYTTKETEVRRG